MSTDLVGAAVRRSNRNLLLGSSLVALLVLAIVALQWRYLVSFVAGPTPISQADIAALAHPDDAARSWVSVRGDEVYETGYVYGPENSDRVDANYLALFVGDHILIVKTPDTGTTTEYNGALVTFPRDEQIIAQLEQDYPEAQGAFLPFMLDASNFRMDGYIWYSLAAIVLLGCCGGALRALRRMADPLTHPFFKQLSPYGQPQAVASDIEHELLAPRASIGKVFVTEHWFVSRTSGFHAARLQDVVWIYRHVTKTKYYGVITVNTRHAVHLWDRFGQKIEVHLKEQHVHDVIELVLQHAPWAVAGYTDELQHVWNQQRADLIDAVDERRHQAIDRSLTFEPTAG